MQRGIGDEVRGGDASIPTLDYAGPHKRPRRPISPIWKVLGAGVATLILFQLIGAWIAPLFPQAWDARIDAIIPSSLPPGRFLSAEFVIDGQGIGRGSGMRMQHGLITFRGQGTPGSLAFDLEHDTCQSDSYTGEESGHLPLTREAVLTYVQRAGYPTADPQAKAVTDQLWSQILRMKSRPLTHQCPRGSMRSGFFEYSPTQRRFISIDVGLKGSALYGLPWYTPWVLLVWLVVWVLIASRIVRRRKMKPPVPCVKLLS